VAGGKDPVQPPLPNAFGLGERHKKRRPASRIDFFQNIQLGQPLYNLLDYIQLKTMKIEHPTFNQLVCKGAGNHKSPSPLELKKLR